MFQAGKAVLTLANELFLLVSPWSADGRLGMTQAVLFGRLVRKARQKCCQEVVREA